MAEMNIRVFAASGEVEPKWVFITPAVAAEDAGKTRVAVWDAKFSTHEVAAILNPDGSVDRGHSDYEVRVTWT